MYVVLEAAVASMLDISASPYYLNAFFMHTVALLPELKMKLRKNIMEGQACGDLDYTREPKEDSSRMLAATKFQKTGCGAGVARNIELLVESEAKAQR